MTTLFGRNAIVYLQGSGSDAELLSEAAEFHIALDFEEGDDGAFGDTWTTTLKGRMKWSGSLNGNYDTDSTLAWDAATQTTSRKLYIYPDRAAMTRYYYGTAFPKLNVDGTLTTVVKFSGSMGGDGQLAVKP